MLKETAKKENYAEIFLSEPRKGVRKLKVRSQPMASRKRFLNDRELKRENGLCDVIVVIATFLHQRLVAGEAFGSKYKPYFTW